MKNINQFPSNITRDCLKVPSTNSPKINPMITGTTVQGGLTVPVTTTAHGSAFAIAGKNEANLAPILNYFKIALSMSQNKKN